MKQFEIKASAQQVGIAGDTVTISSMAQFQYAYGVSAPSVWQTSTTGERTGPFVSDNTSVHPLWVKTVGLDPIKVSLDVRHPVNKSNLVYDMSSFDDEIALADSLSSLKGLQATAGEIDGAVNNTQTIVLLGDSLIASEVADANQLSSFGMFNWANAISGNKFVVLNYAGVGGENSSQILARVDTDVIPYSPKFCMFVCGMNNDTSQSSTDSVKADIEAIYDKLNRAGIFSIILTNMPKTSDILMTKRAMQVNAWASKFFIEKPNCVVIDIFSSIISPTGTDGSVVANSYRDDRHQSNYGAYLEGYEIAKFLSKFDKTAILPSSALDTISLNTYSYNFTKNPVMIGTTGTKDAYSTGIVATDVLVYGSATVTNVCSIEARSDGIGNNQVVVATSTGDAESKIYSSGTITGLNEGDIVFATAEIEIDASSNNFSAPMFALEINNSTAKRVFLSNYTPIYAIPLKENLKIIVQTPLHEVASGFTSIRALSVCKMKGAGTSTIKIGRVAIYKVEP